jgi:hypothetical protein
MDMVSFRNISVNSLQKDDDLTTSTISSYLWDSDDDKDKEQSTKPKNHK